MGPLKTDFEGSKGKNGYSPMGSFSFLGKIKIPVGHFLINTKILLITRFYELTERMSKMEATIAPILGKLDTILGRIDDAKRMKKQKKEAMASLITTIEEDEQRE